MARRPWHAPLSLLLYALSFFSTNVLALSAVLGVDLGTAHIKATLVKPGVPLDIVQTKDSRRKEISAVAFKPTSRGPPKVGEYPERLYGSDAIALAARYPGDVYPNLKMLLGLPADSALVQEYAARHPALKLEAHKTRGTTALRSAGAFAPEEEAWLVEELLAMQLQSVRANAQALAKGDTVRSIVLTVPSYYTLEEKRAVGLAAQLAGLNVLSLISDGLAVGVNYATTRQFPNTNEGAKPEYHMVFDMGAGSTKATVLRFQSRTVKDVGKYNKTVQEVHVVGSGWDRTLGGDALNGLIFDDMVAKFVESPAAAKVKTDGGVTAEGVRKHGRAVARLMKETERLRQVLSANQNTQASFEGLYADVDFRYKITRADFEAMAAPYAERVGAAIQKALAQANLDISQLDSVILHGGGSRTPFVQKELERVLGNADKIRPMVNSDEAAVFGAGFRAATLSPSFRVKEIRVFEAAGYPTAMRWTSETGKVQHQRLWKASSHLGGEAKEVTFTKKHEDFSVTFYQQTSVIGAFVTSEAVEADSMIFTTTNLTETVVELVEKHKCEKADIKFKVGVKLNAEHGEVEVIKASLECEAEEPKKEGLMDGVKNLFGFGGKDEQQPLADPDKAGMAGELTEGEGKAEMDNPSAPTVTSDTSELKTALTASASSLSAAADSESRTPKKNLIAIPVKYTWKKAGIPQLSQTEAQALADRLKAFEVSDQARRQRAEILNQLEAFTYQMRDLLESNKFSAASTAEERATVQVKSSEASDWLYGEGADAPHAELKTRLKELKNLVAPIQKRIDEAVQRPTLVKELQEALVKTKEFFDSVKAQISEYEAYKSSQADAAVLVETAATTAASGTTTAPTPATAPDDLADLEDDGESSTTAGPVIEKTKQDVGPSPPLYTLDDLKESETLHTEISIWLETQLAAQDKLSETDDPVLLSRDIKAKRDKLDKAGVDLAMKSVRNFEKTSKQKTGGKGKKAKGRKPASAEGGNKAGQEEKAPRSDEEIEKIVREFMARQKEEGSGKMRDKEEKKEEEEAGARGDTKETKVEHEIKHEEL